ncbi:hypothetical protein BDA96_02G443600 [Sorghum bicolor]|uniref:Pentacotripeptide-repeat region of PRORP domain-containing protein n=2 Tax=Sorghum bicolor TaxID=4558 RepID=A0A921RVS9_SORBI|nr:hypothetical protein BDA96_02G443600 [Sorghum bicolor]KAG0546392.1 hypothetical protein BDA96_02G443600 [Sorghum bicolor]KAG0546395.1 hypothetical protein BDA96_02G443600 [Sorghum bicolor]OQU90502.1 hypothetical protein SORBI_3002G423400 [Sorghum bicolor]OQU90505.1 hypothetical protein SORBI_3002G423400 [Sorghum bicolor]
MFLAKRPPWSSQITRFYILPLHAVSWIVWCARRVHYSGGGGGGDSATPGTSGRLSELFCPARVQVAGVIGRALEQGRSSDSVELELERLHVDLDPFVVNRVLRSVSDSETAVQFYWWAESRPGFDHTQFAIAYIVSLLFIDSNFFLLSEFLERVRSQGVTLHRSLYRILLSGYVRAGKFDSVIQTFDEMVTSGCREFGVDYNRFIGVLVKNCCFDLVEKYYGVALDKGFCLTSFTYSRWISALCQSDRIELVERLLADMDKFGCFPDIWACNIYVDYLCKQNRLHDALMMLENMEMRGTGPDVVTYTTIVGCLCDNKQFAEAVELWEEMMRRGVKPDIISCGVLIFGLCKSDKVDEAFELALRMLSLNLELNVCIYNALISGFMRSGSINKAFKIISFMQANGCEPDVVTYNIRLNHYCDAGMIKEAEMLIEEMEMSGVVNPDRYSYNQMLKGLCKAHQLDRAFGFVSDHMEVGGFCDIVSCNILIDAFCKAKKVTSALKLFKEMGYKGIQADAVTYGTLINGLYGVGYCNLAEEIFEQMLKAQMIQKEVSPDVITFNTLIYWLGKSSRAIEAVDLFRDMRARGVEPDSLTFRYLISGLLEEGKATLAYEVWEYMMENGIILDRDVSDRLISMLKSKNK